MGCWERGMWRLRNDILRRVSPTGLGSARERDHRVQCWNRGGADKKGSGERGQVDCAG